MNDRADALTLVHHVERLVDVFQRHCESDELVNLDLVVKVLLNHIRQLRSTLAATKGRASPDSPGYELERAGRDFLAGASDANNRRLTPSLVATLERRTH